MQRSKHRRGSQGHDVNQPRMAIFTHRCQCQRKTFVAFSFRSGSCFRCSRSFCTCLFLPNNVEFDSIERVDFPFILIACVVGEHRSLETIRFRSRRRIEPILPSQDETKSKTCSRSLRNARSLHLFLSRASLRTRSTSIHKKKINLSKRTQTNDVVSRPCFFFFVRSIEKKKCVPIIPSFVETCDGGSFGRRSSRSDVEERDAKHQVERNRTRKEFRFSCLGWSYGSEGEDLEKEGTFVASTSFGFDRVSRDPRRCLRSGTTTKEEAFFEQNEEKWKEGRIPRDRYQRCHYV